MGFTMPLTLWNRNKGNIKIAEIEHKRNNLFIEQKRQQIQTEVLMSWQNMQKSIQEYEKVQKLYSSEFDQVFEGVRVNFQKRNISILEFVDFFESYNESLAEYERTQVQLLLSATFINFVTAFPVYSL
jgi:cobalt-zinc-cadmium efflux system outer membrane protein